MKTFIGTISSGRVQSNQEPCHWISISLKDDLSGVRILEINMLYEEYGKFVSGGSGVVEFNLYGTEHIGMKHENKTVLMPRPSIYKPTQKEMDAIVKPFEVDGWKADTADLTNHHNWADNNQARVSMFRYVKVEKEDDKEK